MTPDFRPPELGKHRSVVEAIQLVVLCYSQAGKLTGSKDEGCLERATSKGDRNLGWPGGQATVAGEIWKEKTAFVHKSSQILDGERPGPTVCRAHLGGGTVQEK